MKALITLLITLNVSAMEVCYLDNGTEVEINYLGHNTFVIAVADDIEFLVEDSSGISNDKWTLDRDTLVDNQTGIVAQLFDCEG